MISAEQVNATTMMYDMVRDVVGDLPMLVLVIIGVLGMVFVGVLVSDSNKKINFFVSTVVMFVVTFTIMSSTISSNGHVGSNGVGIEEVVEKTPVEPIVKQKKIIQEKITIDEPLYELEYGEGGYWNEYNDTVPESNFDDLGFLD